MATDHIDAGKGAPSSTVRPTSSVLTSNTPEHVSHTAQGAVAHTPLELFQWLVGIRTPPCLKHSSESGTGIDNIGLYQRAKHEERKNRLKYRLTGNISNILYLLQIMLAAAFTGLSAYKEANAVALTILGAFNTVVAG